MDWSKAYVPPIILSLQRIHTLVVCSRQSLWRGSNKRIPADRRNRLGRLNDLWPWVAIGAQRRIVMLLKLGLAVYGG